MMIKRHPLSTGTNIIEINNKAQSMLPGMVELLVNGFGEGGFVGLVVLILVASFFTDKK